MRRTTMMLVGAVAALTLSVSGAGAALAQGNANVAAAEIPEECSTYNFIEWLFHHECHGHG